MKKQEVILQLKALLHLNQRVVQNFDHFEYHYYWSEINDIQKVLMPSEGDNKFIDVVNSRKYTIIKDWDLLSDDGYYIHQLISAGIDYTIFTNRNNDGSFDKIVYLSYHIYPFYLLDEVLQVKRRIHETNLIPEFYEKYWQTDHIEFHPQQNPNTDNDSLVILPQYLFEQFQSTIPNLNKHLASVNHGFIRQYLFSLTDDTGKIDSNYVLYTDFLLNEALYLVKSDLN